MGCRQWHDKLIWHGHCCILMGPVHHLIAMRMLSHIRALAPPKPFSPTELVPRIKAALRKRDALEWAEPSEPIVLGEVAIDYAECRVTLAGRPVHLTGIEYGLLFELSVNAGRVVTYDRLLRRVWGPRVPGTRNGCAPPPSSSVASWATMPTTPYTSSPSRVSATAWRRRRRQSRRGRELVGGVVYYFMVASPLGSSHEHARGTHCTPNGILL